MKKRTERPPKIRPPMPRGDRAKQFAPFAALGSMDSVLEDIEMGRPEDTIERIQNLEDFEYMCAEDADEETRKWQTDSN